MADVLALDDLHDRLGDVLGVIADALERLRDEDDLERFDARTIPTFSDDDLIEALFAKPAA